MADKVEIPLNSGSLKQEMKSKNTQNFLYFHIRFSSKEELSFNEAKEYAYKLGLYDNEDDKYYVLGYSSLTKDNFNEKYN